MATLTEPELMASRRAWPKAQELLAGVPERRLPGLLPVGWHGTETEPEPVAVVRRGGDHEDLIGEILKVTRADVAQRSVFVYVFGARGIPPECELSLPRRAFFDLGLLALESLDCIVEVTF